MGHCLKLSLRPGLPLRKSAGCSLRSRQADQRYSVGFVALLCRTYSTALHSTLSTYSCTRLVVRRTVYLSLVYCYRMQYGT